MPEHLNEYYKILTCTQNLEVTIVDKEKTLLLLLSDSYDHLTITLLYGKSETIYENITNVLTNNE